MNLEAFHSLPPEKGAFNVSAANCFKTRNQDSSLKTISFCKDKFLLTASLTPLIERLGEPPASFVTHPQKVLL
jgi:hypothetical protein